MDIEEIMFDIFKYGPPCDVELQTLCAFLSIVTNFTSFVQEMKM